MRPAARGGHRRCMSILASRPGFKWPAIAVPVAAVVAPLSFVLWPPPAGVPAPPPAVLPALVVIGVLVPSLAFGAGVAFAVFGRSLLLGAASPALSRATYVSITWLLVNWWPHSNFHRVAQDWQAIIAIDFVFHTTLIAASLVVAAYWIESARRAPRLG